MRREIPDVERCRVSGEPDSGPYGAFRVVCPLTRARLTVIASDGRDWADCGLPSEPWEHVSVSALNRCPTWEEMAWVRRLFWLPEECVVQFSPPESVYVNDHPHVLHWWRPVGVTIPLPPLPCV